MQTFEEFCADVARNGGTINVMFEQRLFDLISILKRIVNPLMAERVPHELVGGLAVLVHVEAAASAHSMLTRDVDLMINRADLERVKEIAGRHGFRFRHRAALEMLMYGVEDSARYAIHLIFSGEKVRPDQVTPNPEIQPERRNILGEEVFVVPVADLLRMKLSSYRLKDQVHIQAIDAAGLITSTVEQTLPPELQARLQQVRETE